MTIQHSTNWLDVYNRLVALESQLQELRQLVWTLKPKGFECHNPVKLEGIWADTDITEDDITEAKRSMFSYERKSFEV